ncbi:MAG: glycosyltransferase family 4 protein [Candidatus Sumerlaeaceae bacterium]|nr:glycosyltransferase family 4 protein [Candidatus Sumerlaeaceae bacterium]
MKICFAVRALPVHRLGGLEFHALDLADNLAKRGHGVTVFTSRHPAGLEAEELPSGVRIQYLSCGTPGDYTRSFYSQLGREIAAFETREAPDVIHSHEFAGLFLQARRARLYCSIHGTMFSEVPLSRKYIPHLSLTDKVRSIWRYKSRILLNPAFRRMLIRANRLVVDSNYTKAELTLIKPDLAPKTSKVTLGVDQSRYSCKPRSPINITAPLTLIHLGRIQEMKGLPDVLAAACTLRDRGVKFRIIIGGTGDYLETLRRKVASSGLQSHVDLRGRIPADAVSDFLAEGDLFLFPDRTQPAFGLVAVEAMLHGLPIIGTRCGAIPETVTEDVGWLYNAWDAPGLATLIQGIAADHSTLAAKAAAAREKSKWYNAQRMASDMEAVYNS